MGLEQRQDDARGLRSREIVGDTLFLVLNNTLAAVEDGRLEIVNFLGPLAPLAQNRLEVLFEELVSNIVRHGFERGSSQSIHVRAEKSAEAITLTFEDDGVPFNLLETAPPKPFTDIEAAPVGGLGISLIRKMSSALRYERLVPSQTGDFRPCNRVAASIAI